MDASDANGGGVVVRCGLRPGDVGEIVRLHGVVYAREYGFNCEFEAYVAGPLAACVLRAGARDRVWVAERAEGAQMRMVGCVAMVDVEGASNVGQVRWFLVDPSARGLGLGRRLLREAMGFANEAGFERVMLWTVSQLEAAAGLYREMGFELVEEVEAKRWGVGVVEQRYEVVVGK